LHTLPQAFFDFVEELKLEKAQNTRLNALVDWLHTREVILLAGDHDLGPGALFFQAFAGRTRVLPLEDWPEADGGDGALVFWEGDHTGEPLARLPRATHPASRGDFLLFCHRPLPESEKANPGPGVHLLGPEWRLEDFLQALSPERSA
jgi:hypothetical protein